MLVLNLFPGDARWLVCDIAFVHTVRILCNANLLALVVQKHLWHPCAILLAMVVRQHLWYPYAFLLCLQQAH